MEGQYLHFRKRKTIGGVYMTMLVLLLAGCAHPEPKFGRKSRVLEECIFESSPHFQSCHSASILELPNGELLCTFFAGTRESHPDVEIWLSRKPVGRWPEKGPFSLETFK